MNTISTHILDVTLGKPAQNVTVRLDKSNDNAWQNIGEGKTNADGRIANFNESFSLEEGLYRLTFETAEYFQTIDSKTFYPIVQIAFEVSNQDEHYHVPLLLSPFGYSTYRGS